MEKFFIMFANLWRSLLGLLDRVKFTVGGYTVSVYSLILAFLVLGIIIGVFWKGAKT